MSIAAVVTGGIGPGSSIPLLLTKGYAIGEAVEPAPVVQSKGGYLPPKRRTKPQWQDRDEEQKRLEDALEAVYNDVLGLTPEPEIVEAVAPYVRTKNKPKTKLPRARRVDFARMARDTENARQILRQLREMRDEDDAVAVLLLM